MEGLEDEADQALARLCQRRVVDSMSEVSVLVIDCTTTGAVPPTVTEPMRTGMERRRVGGMVWAGLE
jgi:hypothetical protein